MTWTGDSLCRIRKGGWSCWRIFSRERNPAFSSTKERYHTMQLRISRDFFFKELCLVAPCKKSAFFNPWLYNLLKQTPLFALNWHIFKSRLPFLYKSFFATSRREKLIGDSNDFVDYWNAFKSKRKRNFVNFTTNKYRNYKSLCKCWIQNLKEMVQQDYNWLKVVYFDRPLYAHCTQKTV